MNKLFYLFLLFSITLFAQKKVIKTIDFQTKSLVINTFGLDAITVENSENQLLEIELFAENALQQHIVFETRNEQGILKFNLSLPTAEKEVFRKYITKRLNRASVKLKVPENCKLTFNGNNINIITQSIQNNMDIFLDKGILKFGTISSKIFTKLYGGNIYADVSNSNFTVSSNLGDIIFKEKTHKRQLVEKKATKQFNLEILSIKANIFLE